jgi:capsular polysaccharide biosynthesis protein
MQEGAIYTLLGNIVPESIRKSGIDGDAIIDTNPIKLSIFKVISLCVTCIFNRRIVINSYYLGPWFSSLGHFLIESITRINSKMLSRKAKWVFHTMDSSPLHQQIFPYQEKLLSIIGVRKDRILLLIDKPYLLFNTSIVIENAVFPKELKSSALEVINLVKSSNNSNADFGDRVYLSRQKLPKNQRRLPDDLSVFLENLFKSCGFQIIHPQELEILDQISAVSKARYIAGPQGSALHLSIFCESGTKIFEIGDEIQTIYPNTQQKIICNLLNQDFYFFPYDVDKKTFDFEFMKTSINS